MSFSLIPKFQFDSLTEVTPAMLKSCDIRFLMLDFDNTIVPYTNDTPTEEMQAWLRDVKASGVGLSVVSNSKKGRVVRFCEQWDIPCITHSRKPFQKGIRQCQEQFRFHMSRAALVGDQIYTDVLGANCAGAVSILVKPIHLHNIWLRLRHVLELPFIAIGKRRYER